MRSAEMKVILAVILCLSLILSGCKKKEGENDMESEKEKLIDKILQQPYGKDVLPKAGTVEDFLKDVSNPTPSPVVSLEDFFEGNEDIGSIGANLIEHPGIETFYRVLKEIRKREDVQDVLIIINQIDEHLDWPFSESLYIFTSCSKEQVSEWVKPLKPDDIAEGWIWGKPPAAPQPKEGYKVFWIWWD